MADDSPTGSRPVQFIFLSSDAQPLTIQPGDRRFWVVEDAKTLTLDCPADASGVDITRAFNAWVISRRLASDADATLARAEQHAAEHPSRTAPLCIDCRHMKLQSESHMQFHVCAVSPSPPWPRTGRVSDTPCTRAREAGLPCGPAGQLFELRDPPVLLSDEEAAVMLTAAELAQARWSPGVGPGPSSQSPASPAPVQVVD